MASTITLIPKDDDAERIIDAFAERTGLTADRSGEQAVFDVSGDHELPVVQTLTDIDPGWTDHLEIGRPAA